MSSISSFDFIAAVAPALRQAIDQGTADPHRWRMVDHKLIDSKSGKRWYEEDKSDEVIENEEIEKWSKQIECRQLTTVETLHEVLDTYKSRWQKTGFESIESLNINNIHDSGEDYHTLWACSQMKDFIHENNMQLNQNPNSYESGLLIICGMGSPRAMSRLITITKPKIILIFEDNLDVICAMLSKNNEAEILLSTTQANKSTLIFVTDNDADLAILKASSLIEMISLRSQGYCFKFAFKKSNTLDLINKEFFSENAFAKTLRFKGFFTDELHMLLNGILTFSHTNTEIIQPRKEDRTKRHAVIVASGPSLRSELPKLKQFRDRYDLFCAFSTLGTLLKENIKPDYHCHIERHYDKNIVQSTDELKEFCKESILLTSANVDPRLAQLYKKVYAILRSGSSASALHMEGSDDMIFAEGTNAGTFAVVVAILLGYDTLHVFGLDLGAIKKDDLRIENALNKTEREMTIEVNGNLRETVWTDQFLLDSVKVLATFLNPEVRPNYLKDIKVYNYSDGQMIPHTISSLPSSFTKNIDIDQSTPHTFKGKIKTRKRYQKNEIYNKIIASSLHNKIKLQCQIIRELCKSPLKDESVDLFSQSCADTFLYSIGRGTGSDQILTRLLGSSITRIWIFISTINRLVPDNKRDMWEQICKKILKSCIDSMECLSIEMLEHSLSIEKLEDHRLQSVYPERRDKL